MTILARWTNPDSTMSRLPLHKDLSALLGKSVLRLQPPGQGSLPLLSWQGPGSPVWLLQPSWPWQTCTPSSQSRPRRARTPGGARDPPHCPASAHVAMSPSRPQIAMHVLLNHATNNGPNHSAHSTLQTPPGNNMSRSGLQPSTSVLM